MKTSTSISLLAFVSIYANAFVPTNSPLRKFVVTQVSSSARISALLMSEPSIESVKPENSEDEEESPMDAATKKQQEKARRADELRMQETFMTRKTGKHNCGNCDWQYDEAKGDVMTIGGMVQPGTPFDELPSNWRCPTCRASKDIFEEVLEEIPGFEVNQGYGLGGNALTSGQKSGLIFGGLLFFFLLFLSGYAMS